MVKVLPPTIGEPNYETINEIVQCLCGNVDTLLTTLGRGKHRHTRIIMNTYLYETILQTAYAEPSKPGTVLNIPGMATAADHAQQRDYHMVSRKVYKNQFNMYASLKTLTIDAIEDFILVEQRNCYIGYLGVIPQQLEEKLMQSPPTFRPTRYAWRRKSNTRIQ